MNEKEELINLYFTFKSDAVLSRLLQKYGKAVLLEMDDYAESSDVGLYMYVNMVIVGSVKEELYQLNSKQLKKVFNNIISRFSDEQNIDFKYDVIKFIYDNIQYAEFNTKSDYCQVCGYDGEMIINDQNEWECPQCGNKDHNKMNVVRRTCGYLGENFWNVGKTKEIKSRVLHL